MHDSDFTGNYINRISTLPAEKQAILLEKLAPLSESQKRIYAIEKNLDDLNNVTLIPLIISTGIDIRTIEQTINLIARKHETLRTVFIDVCNELRQLVLPFKEIRLSAEKLPASASGNENERIRTLISRIEAERFDLIKDYLWKCRIYNLENSRNLVLFVFHQTIFDGLSLYVFLNELLTSQNLIENSAGSTNSPLKIQYGDYARWQQKILTPDYLHKTGEIWKARFQNRTANATLTADRPRPAKPLSRAEEIETAFSENETGDINRFCSTNKLTLPMLGAAVLALALFKTTEIGETTVGIPIAGRTFPESEKLIGSFVNIAPLSVVLRDDQTVGELLSAVKNEMLFIQENQEYPFRKLLEALYPNRRLANYGALDQEPLVRIFLDYKGKTAPGNSTADVSHISIFDALEKKTGCDIYIKLWEDANISFSFLYNAEAFDQSTMAGFRDLVKETFLKLTENLDSKITDL